MAWLYRQNKSQYWWIGYRINGRQYLRSTRETDRTEAEKLLAQFGTIQEANRAGRLTEEFYLALTQQQQLRRIVLKAAIEEWLTECKGSTAAGTLRRYREIAKAFLSFLKAGDGRPFLNDITAEEIRSFLVTVRADRAAKTVNLYRGALYTFFSRALQNGLLKANPVMAVKRFKASAAEKLERRPYTLEEVALIYDKAPDDFWRYMILGGFYTGLRLGDLICLSWGAVDWERNQIHLTAIKTGRVLHIPLAKPLLSRLKALKVKAGKVGPSDPIWPKQAKHYQAQGARRFSHVFYSQILYPCGLVPLRNGKRSKAGRAGSSVTFHSLRHTFVSLLKVTGSSQSVAKELAGHSSDQVNDLYTHVPEEALVKAIKALPSFG